MTLSLTALTVLSALMIVMLSFYQYTAQLSQSVDLLIEQKREYCILEAALVCGIAHLKKEWDTLEFPASKILTLSLEDQEIKAHIYYLKLDKAVVKVVVTNGVKEHSCLIEATDSPQGRYFMMRDWQEKTAERYDL